MSEQSTSQRAIKYLEEIAQAVESDREWDRLEQEFLKTDKN
jgi:hypothetical protein